MSDATDVRHAVSAVRREVGGRRLEAGEARVVTISRVYATSAGDLWDACTSIERIPRWFLPVSGELEVGGSYRLEGNANGTIERCDAPRSFAATWEYGGEVSWIEVAVDAEGEHARLTIDHIAHVDDERWAMFGPGAVGLGWDLGLYGLALHLASGASVDPQQAEAWSTSRDGVAFLTAASDDWFRASVAAGTPEAEARPAADRTTAFYTGAEPPAES
ncbi:MAG: SRPBCC family protein [Pseudonocardia sp.]|uniref:SRPBCC family protein n=1 Tax=unclassified Pseudonocardia TaxID=2619320 RepID=UPI00086C8086|nr:MULTISPECIES: SRPBCC family protein [unclassified Pseudonocardia]MBN9110597.1 SRPBCC family protein [Pseudonocardia sp.]ODV04322.1 MAG: polyketide cyclase [Pseudonocardia sp. SCN 73-27]